MVCVYDCMVCSKGLSIFYIYFFFLAEDGIRDGRVTGVQTCALPIFLDPEPGLLRLPGIRGVEAALLPAVQLVDAQADRHRPDRVANRDAQGRPAPRLGQRRSEERRVGKECNTRWPSVRQKTVPLHCE